MLPKADRLASVSFAVVSVLFLFATLTYDCDSQDANCNDNEGTGLLLTGAIAVPAVIYGAAAHTGFSRTAACRRAIQDYYHRQAQQPQNPSPTVPVDAPPPSR